MDNELFSCLDQEGENVAYLQQELVSRPALGPENGGQGEQDKADFLLSYLSHIGLHRVRNLASPDPRVESGQRPNLMAVLPGRNTSRTLWIVSHMDVVPAGDLQLWKTDPFTLARDGDRIFGRGVEDNHHGLVASLLAVKTLISTRTPPAMNLGLLLVADEETGNAHGLEYVLNEHRSEFQSQDQFLVPDFGEPDSSLIEIAEKGLLWLKLTVHGQQCHASTPQAGKNSLLAAAQCIMELRKLYTIFDATNHLFAPPHSTFESTRIEANVPNVNTIPGRDVFYTDCRVLPGYSLAEVLDRVRSIADGVSRSLGLSIDVDVVHRQTASETNPECMLVSGLQDAISRVYGIQARPGGIGGGTVAAYARHQGFPAAVWGTLPGNAHQPNEQTSIRNILQDAKVMSVLACGLD
ncbi:M20 family metallo-hydrolase [Desulfovermiculus halophilus]|jgi:succinyl-diaminopimelate desuccinylase|uniref:M20 family metallo-hydrolase n=1 Tax=Desulfovermiculus halophilus TaxID=339722 RepID=UPI00047FF29C|nr:M20 family metallo-hydrolase [Desulfovermiculus halophilus]